MEKRVHNKKMGTVNDGEKPVEDMNLLLCRPKYFGVHYEINPWMDMRRPARAKLAMKQWLNLCKTLKEVGAHLHFIPPRPGFPDMVFVANAGSFLGGKFVPSQFRWPQRRGEEPFFKNYIQGHFHRLFPLSTSSYFEGEGDLLPFRDIYFAGYGIRSEMGAHKEISKKMKLPMELLRLIHPRFYHLDTCFLPLDDHTALFYPPAFNTTSIKKIKRHVPDAIAVGHEDAFSFACNGFRIGKRIILHKASLSLKEALYQRGYVTCESAVGEFLKAGGSVKCMLLKTSNKWC